MPKIKTIELLGTTLEGGGQLLRLSTSLAALTSSPICVTQIRGNRGGGGGLKLQHLRAVEWLAQASGAQMVGADKGSKTLEFWPGENKRPDIKLQTEIDIGSPGSVALVFQAILPYLIFDGASHLAAGRKSIKIRISGGTNVSNSPSIEYIQHVLLPTLHKIGLPRMSLTLEKRGWSTGPTEIGSVMFSVDPLSAGSTLPAFALVDRGAITHIEAYALAPAACRKYLDSEIKSQVYDQFGQNITLDLRVEDSRNSKRLYLLLVAISGNGHRLGRDWLYDQKIRSLDDAVPKLIKRVIDELGEEIHHGGCVDEYMRDQLVVFQALAAGQSDVDAGRSRDGKVVDASLHALTAYWVSFQVLGVKFDREGICAGCGMKAKGPVN